MNIMEVDRFLNDSRFTETAPRPPVPGEENELQSNGGISTKSSGSHKTHSSGKSERSNKSHSPAATPRRSNLDKTLTGGSLSCSDTKLNGDEEAPLGFEPEGSAECGNTPPFVETNASTPSYLKWAEDLKSLLEDGEGVKLFKQFLDNEQCSNTLEFWFACRGIKLVSAEQTDKLASLIKLIYKKYIKGDQLKLDPKIKKGIAEKLKREKYDQTLFDEAQENIENVMKNDSYPLFLKSDIYVQFVQNGGESPKNSHSTSGSSSVRPLSGPLPTLHEEKELKQEDIKNNLANTTLPLNPNTLAATRDIRGAYNHVSFNNTPRFKRPEGVFAQPSHPVHRSSFPYHVSYAPASERDSENTSDAHTDDTMSLTDSSIDGRDAPYGSKRWKKSQKVMRNNQCTANRRTGLDQHIPRTQRPAPRDRNLAETDPKGFAAILISKLESHLKDTNNEEYVKSLNLEPTTDEESDMGTERCSVAPVQGPNNKNTLTVLMAMMEAKDEDPQGILDEHFNRIWDSSSGQTPSRSPGRHSPDRNLLSKSTMHYPSFSLPGNKSVHLSDSSFNVTAKSHHLDSSGLGSSVGAPVSKTHHRTKKDKQATDAGMSLSFDANVTDSFYEDPHFSTNKHSVQIHHHHHHHHHTTKDSAGKLRAAAGDHLADPKAPGMQRYPGGGPPGGVSSTVVYDDRIRAKELARQAATGSAGKRMSDSTGDSGVYLSVYDQPLRVPNMHDPSNEKVLNWMLDNEKISTNHPQYSTDGSTSDRGSSHKRSHKSSGSSKKTPYDPSRGTGPLDGAAGLSHSYSYPAAVAGGGGGVMNTSLQPTQPISQDPSMPLLNPPNPTVLLEEARRKLLDEDKRAQQQVAAATAAMRQSKSFTAALQQQQQQLSGKDKQRVPASSSMPPPPLPPRGIPPKHHGQAVPSNIPSAAGPLDLSAHDEYSGQMQYREKRKLPAPVSTSSGLLNSSAGPQSEYTVVGYYFCGESIPYRTTVHSTQVTLGQFKQHISKRGIYRYFFKKASDEFETGVVYEEVSEDNDLLPLCEGKIIGKVEKVE